MSHTADDGYRQSLHAFTAGTEEGQTDKRTDGHRDGHGTVFIRLPVRVITCLETKHEGKSKSVFLHGVLQSLTNWTLANRVLFTFSARIRACSQRSAAPLCVTLGVNWPLVRHATYGCLCDGHARTWGDLHLNKVAPGLYQSNAIDRWKAMSLISHAWLSLSRLDSSVVERRYWDVSYISIVPWVDTISRANACNDQLGN